MLKHSNVSRQRYALATLDVMLDVDAPLPSRSYGFYKDFKFAIINLNIIIVLYASFKIHNETIAL